MARIVRVNAIGGPEVLEVTDAELPSPAAGEVTVRHDAIGLNFLDTYFRSGLYPAPDGLPMTPGSEAAGTVTAIGAGVSELAVGDRVAYVSAIGAYASERNIAADRLVRLPDSIDAQSAAGMMLKGMTVEYLLRRTFPVKPGDTILFHAAAGGVGLIAGQWARHLGATVIGTAGSPEKCDLARAHGYDHVINYREQAFVDAVNELTDGKGVDVVYDSVGRDTYPGSLDCLKPRGMWVSFGQSSGALEPVNLGILAQKGSLFVTRPTLFAYIATRAELEQSAQALFDVVSRGVVKIAVNQTYSLDDIQRAHTDLEGRKTSGTTVIIP